MEYEYNVIGYKSLYNDVNSMIEKLKSINVNVDKYSILVKEIDTKLNNDVNDRLSLKNNNLDDDNSYLFDFGVENIYIPYMKALNNIKKSLESYNFVFVIYNVCNYINYGIDNVDINTLIDNCIECLNFMNKVNILDYNDIYSHIGKFYDVVYLVVKKEILVNGNSKVFNYLLDYNTHISNLDSIIKKDIDNNDLLKVDKIKIRCSELYSKGLNSSYVDIDLIKLIVFEENKENLINSDIDNIRVIGTEFLENNNELDKNRNALNKEDNYHKEIKDSFNKAIGELILPGIPLGIVGALILYGGLGFLPNARFLKEKKYSYNSKKTTYVDGKLDSVIEDNITIGSELDDRVITIYDYEPWETGYKYRYKRDYNEYKYEASSNETIDIKKLFDMDLSTYNNIVKTDTEMSDDLVIDCDRKVVIEENNKLGEELVRSNGFLAFCEAFYILIVFLLDLGFYDVTDSHNLLFGKLFSLIINFILNGIEYSKDRKKYKEDLNKIIDGIKSNEIIRSRFNIVYHEFVSKYGEIDELKDMYNRVNNVKYDDIDDILVKKKIKI